MSAKQKPISGHDSLSMLLAAIRRKTVAPKADYVTKIVGKTSAQA